MKPILLFLTCANELEAQRITDALLDQHLVACVKWQTVMAPFIWQGKRESAREVLLIMETIEELYETIYAQIRIVHSYQIFVLQAVVVSKLSSEVQAWLKTELRI